MKFRSGFVSNSSSTSFMVVFKDPQFGLSDFLELMGVSPKSPVATKVNEVFEEIMHGRIFNSEDPHDMEYFKEWECYSEDYKIQDILEFQKKGYKVLFGDFQEYCSSEYLWFPEERGTRTGIHIDNDKIRIYLMKIH